MSVYGVIFYLPTQVAALLGKKVGLEVGLVARFLGFCAGCAFALPRLADQQGSHRPLAAASLVVSGLGIALSAGSGPGLALLTPSASLLRVHRGAAAVLDLPDQLPRRSCCGRWYRADQCARRRDEVRHAVRGLTPDAAHAPDRCYARRSRERPHPRDRPGHDGQHRRAEPVATVIS